MENLNDFPPRATFPADGAWRMIHTSNGYRVDLECGGDCRIRIVESGGPVIWMGLAHHAQMLAGGLNSAACVKIGP